MNAAQVRVTQVAFFSADMGNYPAAIKIFEEVGRKAADNNLLRFSARGHLLNAGLCHLAGVPRHASVAPLAWSKRQQLRLDGLCSVGNAAPTNQHRLNYSAPRTFAPLGGSFLSAVLLQPAGCAHNQSGYLGYLRHEEVWRTMARRFR